MKLIINLFKTIVFVSSCGWAVNADLFWGQWHGPANGRACLESGSTGPYIQLSQSLNLVSLLEYTPAESSDIFMNGVLVRADDSSLYLKKNKDYIPAQKVLWKINPENGSVVWHTDSASGGEDLSNPRAFQLYNDPRGFNSLHVQPYYAARWDTYRMDKDSTQNLLGGSHCCLGSRILMGRWAWKNQEGKTWSHTGTLMWWDGTKYVVKNPEWIQIQDHVWENNRCILFLLSGWKSDTTYAAARFMVLDSNGTILQDTPVPDIHRPRGATCCYYGTGLCLGGIADTADILMKLSVQGDFVYGIERTTFDERQLVRRHISDGFKKTDSIVLGTDPLLSNVSYCINDSTLFLQGTDTLTAYSLDLRTIRWKRAIPHRTLFHVFVQGIDRIASPGIRNKILHSLACDTAYLYCVSDSHFLVLDQKNGTTRFDHLFTDLPTGKKPTYSTVYVGPAGSITLLPDYVVVNSTYLCSKLWIFKKSSSSVVKQPFEQQTNRWNLTISPNPYHAGTTISMQFDGAVKQAIISDVQLDFFDARGVIQDAITVSTDKLIKGIVWKGGNNLATGLYCARVSWNGMTRYRKFLVVH